MIYSEGLFLIMANGVRRARKTQVTWKHLPRLCDISESGYSTRSAVFTDMAVTSFNTVNLEHNEDSLSGAGGLVAMRARGLHRESTCRVTRVQRGVSERPLAENDQDTEHFGQRQDAVCDELAETRMPWTFLLARLVESVSCDAQGKFL